MKKMFIYRIKLNLKPTLLKMNWLTIKNFGRIKYFNISYVALILIPIYIDYSSKINECLNSTLIHIPISIRLVFMASLFYALGIALYQYFCPKTIKHYDKVEDYINENFDIYQKAYPDLKLSIVLANLTAQQSDTKKELIDLSKKLSEASLVDKSKIKKDLDKKVDVMFPACIVTYLSNNFNRGLKENGFFMKLSFFFYLSGTCILLFLLFQKSIVVFNF